MQFKRHSSFFIILILLQWSCNPVSDLKLEKHKMTRLSDSLNKELVQIKEEVSRLAIQIELSRKEAVKEFQELNDDAESVRIFDRENNLSIFVSKTGSKERKKFLSETEKLQIEKFSTQLDHQLFYVNALSNLLVKPRASTQLLFKENIDLSNFNFYYEGSVRFNPKGQNKWISKVYLSPIMNDWVFTCLHPVYKDNEVDGVCGINIRVDALFHKYLKDYPLSFIVDSEGSIVIAGEKVLNILESSRLDKYPSYTVVTRDIYRKNIIC